MQKNQEELAKQALSRKKTFTETANTMRPQVANLQAHVESMKGQLAAMESKIAELKTKKGMLSARAQSARAMEEIQQRMSVVDPSSAFAAFDRMEEKVLRLEAQTQAQSELSEIGGLEDQFAALESGSVDEELLALKAQMEAPAPALPPASSPTADSLRVVADPLDAELSQLRQQNNQ